MKTRRIMRKIICTYILRRKKNLHTRKKYFLLYTFCLSFPTNWCHMNGSGFQIYISVFKKWLGYIKFQRFMYSLPTRPDVPFPNVTVRGGNIILWPVIGKASLLRMIIPHWGEMLFEPSVRVLVNTSLPYLFTFFERFMLFFSNQSP